MKIPVVLLFLFTQAATAQQFPVVTANSKVSILYDAAGARLDSIAAHLLAQDIASVTGYKPKVITDVAAAKGNVIVIGGVQSALVQKFTSVLTAVNGKWECYGYSVVKNALPGIVNALVIAGSDARGTAYGVFNMSERIGVSPWHWWADVPAKQKKELIIQQADFISHEPSVKYRGIFINDEDWGLRPWAAETFEREKKNIGPKTYAKVFELLLRLKANLIWPAMHPGTTPFYNETANAQMANAYSIIVGTSHAEPMMRNNVGEWDEKTMGRFNYITNKQKVYDYWRERVKQTAGTEVIYTLGMRGVHDSGMEGVKDAKDAIPLLEQIMQDQRSMLNGRDVPQAFTAYKEVLDIYDKGLKIPDDVTIVWPDDNYGYIQRLNNEAEKKRPGGSGVYYHASYWGRPHDYLWLGTANPALMRFEMMKAYDAGANRLWVVNAGDIKPGEYALQLFLDMAYDAKPFADGNYSKEHLLNWYHAIFPAQAKMITETMWGYYTLAFERKPEFMGWSQTEPTTKTKYTDYNHFYFGDEAQRRIDKYNKLQNDVSVTMKAIAPREKDAFYQLVYYPVVCASWMNKKFLYRDKAYLYAKQNRIAAYNYAKLSMAVYDSIISATKYFNEKLSNGKWNGMMSMKPRNLPVFLEPELPSISIDKLSKWNVLPEGNKTLPVFTAGLKQEYFIDIFLTDSLNLSWSAKTFAKRIVLSQSSGKLTAGKSMQRIWVSADSSGYIQFTAGNKHIDIEVKAERLPFSANGFVESNGLISIPATGFNKQSGWVTIDGLGHTEASIKAVDTTAYVQYNFSSVSTTSPKISIYTLPTHPLNNNFSMRYAVRIDDGPVQEVDFKTIGRSEEWKQNVLRNSAIRTLQFEVLKPGHHTLTFYALDPAVVLDRIVINFGNDQTNYSIIPQTAVK